MFGGIGIVAGSRFNNLVVIPTTYQSLALTIAGTELLWPYDDASGTTVTDVGTHTQPGNYGQSPPPTLAQTAIVTTGVASAHFTDRTWSTNVVITSAQMAAGFGHAVWLKPDSAIQQALGGFGNDFQFNTSSNRGGVLYMKNTGSNIVLAGWHFIPGVGVVEVVGSTVITTSRHMAALVLDPAANAGAGALTIYLDGSQEATSSLGAAPEAFDGYFHDAYCGNTDPKGNGDTVPIFNGNLEMRQVFISPPSAASISALWAMGH